MRAPIEPLWAPLQLHPDAQKLRRSLTCFNPCRSLSTKNIRWKSSCLFCRAYLEEFQLVPIVVGSSRRSSNFERAGSTHQTRHPSCRQFRSIPFSVVFRSNSPRPGNHRWHHKNWNSIISTKPTTEPVAFCRSDFARSWPDDVTGSRVLLHYANSGDTAGNRSRVVGYAAIAFFGDQAMENK